MKSKSTNCPPGWGEGAILVRTVESPDGTSREAFVHPDMPGLAVNRREDLWVVTHIRSGHFIQPGFARSTDAADFARDLFPLTDWSRKGRDLLDDKTLRGAVVQIRDRMNFGRLVVLIAAAPPAGPGIDV